jgi:hypothetical protein
VHVRRDACSPAHRESRAGRQAYFSLVPLNRILDLLRRVAEEMVCLALHRTNPALHPSHPFHDFPVPRSHVKNWPGLAREGRRRTSRCQMEMISWNPYRIFDTGRALWLALRIPSSRDSSLRELVFGR